ncbi:hypothetical protein DFJ58DRAFT_891296, partial [Suillus subalutaceus]|uniref:uncharacterized protein n=1 Tax=Suillus subalutaceus TaxID=48586 RepID=UPI001B864FA3
MTKVMDIMEDFLKMMSWKYLRQDGDTKMEEHTLHAQDCVHHIDQTKAVCVLHSITEKSVEEAMYACVRYKLNIDDKVIQAGRFDNKSTQEDFTGVIEQSTYDTARVHAPDKCQTMQQPCALNWDLQPDKHPFVQHHFCTETPKLPAPFGNGRNGFLSDLPPTVNYPAVPGKLLAMAEGNWEKLSQVAVPGAEYDSPKKQPRPKCLEGTQVDLLKFIYKLLDK